MRIKSLISSILITTTLVISAQTSNYKNSSVQIVKVGGASIKILAPDSSFAQVGTNNMELIEHFVPPVNRLLCAYLLKKDIPYLSNGVGNKIFSKYAFVEVFRQAESFNLDAEYFSKLKSELLKSYNTDVSLLSKETEVEFYQRMSSLGLLKKQIKIDEPVQLGCLFSNQDIIGSGMLMNVDIEGQIIKMGVLTMLMRLQNRLLYVYLFTEYEDEKTIIWLRNMGEMWGDEILKLNRQ